MNNTPLEDQVHDALRRRVDPLQRAPFTVTDVRRRARRIRRRRTLAAGAAVAAALAVAVPVGLAIDGASQRTVVPPATQTPQPPRVTSPVRIDPRSADVGDAPAVTLVDVTTRTLLAGGEEYALPEAYDQITPYGDGWIAMVNVEGVRSIDVLDASFGLVGRTGNTSDLTVSADGTRVAYASYDGGRWSIRNDDVAGAEAERPSTALPEGPDESAVGTLGFVSDDEVLAFRLNQVDGTITTFLAIGEEVVQLPGIDQAVSASPVTGMIAARAVADDGRSCGAAFDGRTRSAEPLWTDCTRTLSAFSPDGSLVAAFPEGDQGSDGDPRGLSVLDARTGEPLVDFEVTPARDHPVGIATQIAWEDDRSLLATYIDGNQQYVVRLGLDGTVERVAGPVTDNDFTRSLRLTPGPVG